MECVKWINVPARDGLGRAAASWGWACSQGYPPAIWWEKGGVDGVEAFHGSEKWHRRVALG